MVDWSFLFHTMAKMGLSEEFVSMTKLLFQGAKTSVKINGAQSAYFDIQRRVRQGCSDP